MRRPSARAKSAVFAACLITFASGQGWVEHAVATGSASRVSLVGRWANGPCEDVAVDGPLVCYGNGGYLHIVNYANPAAPAPLQRLLMPSVVRAIHKDGAYIYVAVGRDGMRIVDATQPAAAFVAGVYSGGGTITDVYAADGYAYLVDNTNGVVIVDVNDPDLPRPTALFTDPVLDPWGITVSGDFAYVAAGTGGFICVNVADKSWPYNYGIYSTGGQALALAAKGDYLYVADWVAGLSVFDISDPSAITQVGAYDAGSAALAVDVFAGHAYVANGTGGLRIIDVTNPSAPYEKGHLPTGDIAKGVAVGGGFAYVAARYDGLRVVNCYNKQNPVEASFRETGSLTEGIDAAPGYIYVTENENGLRVIDISNPAAPTEVGAYGTGFPEGVDVQDGLACLADGSDGLRILDVSMPAAPAEIGRVTPGPFQESVVIHGDYAYVAEGADGVRAIDISDPTAPVVVGHYDTDKFASDIAVQSRYAYVADGGGGLRILDIQQPAQLVEVGAYDTGGLALGVTVAGPLAYIADYGDGLRVIDVSDPTAPVEIGFFDTAGLAMDVALLENPAGPPLACIADYENGLRVLDVGDPASPEEVGHFDTGGYACELALQGDYIYVADYDDGVYVLQFDGTTTPVAFEFFAATAVGDAIHLEWKLGGDEPVSELWIYRGDGRAFVRTGVVPAGTRRHVDTDVRRGRLYRYRVDAVRDNGERVVSTTVTARVPDGRFVLHPNTPNPFRSATSIAFELPSPLPAVLSIYDVLGRRVRVLHAGPLPAGPGALLWDGRDENDQPVGSGAYFCRLQSGRHTATQKLLLVR